MTMTLDEALNASPIRAAIVECFPRVLVRILKDGSVKAMYEENGTSHQAAVTVPNFELFRQECLEKKAPCRPLSL